MTTYDNTNSGSIFKNEKEGNEKRPDFKGSLNVDGKEYWVSAWKRVAGENSKRAGEGFLSIKIEAKDQQSPKPAQTPSPAFNDSDIDF